MKEDKKKVFIRTLGCQMNVRDSEVIAGLLQKEDCLLTDTDTDADIIIYNTCSVRQHAEDKVWSNLGRHRKPKTEDRKPVIGVVGCMAQNYKQEIFQRAPQVDFAVGPTDIAKIPQIINKIVDARRNTQDAILFESKIWETDGGIRPEEIYHTGFYKQKNHAYVVISEGCSNSCSYCIVPYVRGGLKNRDYRDIIGEIEEVIAKGITNITLLGQNVNAYQSSAISYQLSANFIDLLKMVNGIKGLKEFSFITSHPKDTTQGLFETMARCNKLKKYLHLPVQSGSDRILKLMNRGYTRLDYLDLVEAYRKIVTNGALTTDIIVGFPQETETEFQDTYSLIKQVEFDSAYIFKYSLRPHTQAEALADDVPKKEKEKRHSLILKLQKEISRRKRVDKKIKT